MLSVTNEFLLGLRGGFALAALSLWSIQFTVELYIYFT
jgi:hypothetical protein